MIAWALFVNPVTITFHTELWLLLPLCAAVAVVYKTIRCEELGRLPRDLAALMAYMAAGLVGLCASLWLIHEYWP